MPNQFPDRYWNADEHAIESLKEVGVNILHYLDNLDQTTFSMSGLREQLRYALADCGVEPERISPNSTPDTEKKA